MGITEQVAIMCQGVATFDCALIAARDKEDPWNSIAPAGNRESP